LYGLDDEILVDRADVVRQLVHHPVGDVAPAAIGDVVDRRYLGRLGERHFAVADVAGLLHRL